MTIRVSIANFTADQAVRFFAARGFDCSIFPHVGIWQGTVEPGITTVFGFVTPEDRLEILHAVARLLRIIGESSAYVEHADATRGEIWAAEQTGRIE